LKIRPELGGGHRVDSVEIRRPVVGFVSARLPLAGINTPNRTSGRRSTRTDYRPVRNISAIRCLREE